MNNTVLPSTATKISTASNAPLELDGLRTSGDTENAQHPGSKHSIGGVNAASPTSPVRKEAHRLNKKTETYKRKRNRYSFDLGLNNNGLDVPILPPITESKSRESSRPPSRTLDVDNQGEMTPEGVSRHHEESSLARQYLPTRDAAEGRIGSSGSGRYAETTEDQRYRENAGEEPQSSFASTTDVRYPAPVPLSRSTASSAGTSPAISRYASPAVGYSSNASYHDSLGDSGVLDPESDGAPSQGRGSIVPIGSRDTASSEFDTEEDELNTARPLSARMPWSRASASGQLPGRQKSNSQWPWHARRLTIDLLRDCEPIDHKIPHARKPSTEYSPLNRQESETSLAARHDSLANINSSSQTTSSYGNPMAASTAQYPDYHSLPHFGDDLLPKTHTDSATKSFSSDLGQHRRSLRQFLGWMRRRIGLGASGVVELASEASQRVANTAGGQVRLPSGSMGSRKRSKRRTNLKGRRDETFWLVRVLRLVPTQPLTIVSRRYAFFTKNGTDVLLLISQAFVSLDLWRIRRDINHFVEIPAESRQNTITMARLLPIATSNLFCFAIPIRSSVYP